MNTSELEKEKLYRELITSLIKEKDRGLKKNILGEYVQPQFDIKGSKEYEPPETAREIQYKLYWYYAKKYKIQLHKDGHKKTARELALDIHKYEMRNINRIVKKGIDKNTGQLGMYIV